MPSEPQAIPRILMSKKIWHQALHNAMTDLIRYKATWCCAFRESNSHVFGTNGEIRIIFSADGYLWTSAALFAIEGSDLRDPKLSMTSDGRLMLLCGGQVFDSSRNYQTLRSYVAFFDGIKWTTLRPVLTEHEWLWRVTWDRGVAYGVSYSRSDPSDKKKEWYVSLYRSDDGLHYEKITQWALEGYPNETTLRFLPDGTMVALVRRDKKQDNQNFIGSSKHPYTEWQWNRLNHHVGGPNFLILPNGSMWVAGRLLSQAPYGEIEKTFVGLMTFHEVKPLVVLPSGGDCSYPGMVYENGVLSISYYSSHEGKAAIYFAQLLI